MLEAFVDALVDVVLNVVLFSDESVVAFDDVRVVHGDVDDFDFQLSVRS